MIVKSTSVIKAKISRLKLNAKASKFFDELEVSKREIVNRSLEYFSNEEPIFAFFDDIDYWWVITNRRLLLSENGIIKPILFEEVKELKIREIFEENVSNQDCDKIEMQLKDRIEINLRLEKGTWFSVFNLLKFLCS